MWFFFSKRSSMLVAMHNILCRGGPKKIARKPRELLSEMMFLLEIRKTENAKMFYSFLVTWIGML